jgi:two-component system response regulator NreC
MINVLIVDDHAVLRSGLRLLIDGEQDMQVVGEASDGVSALDKLAACKPDVALVDITMPGMNGIEVIRRFKAHEATPCQVLVLTMHPEANYLRPALDAGAAGYVVKSVADDELLDAIRAVHRGQSFLRPEAVAVLLDDSPLMLDPHELLSEREIEVLRLVARGHTNVEIGEQLFLSPKTVDTYRRRVMQKLDMDNRADLVDYALKHGLLKPYLGFDDASESGPNR